MINEYTNGTKSEVLIRLSNKKIVEVIPGDTYFCGIGTHITKIKFPGFTGWRNL